MKKIIPRMIIMLTGIVILAIGIINNTPLAMGAGFFMFFGGLISTIEADMYNRKRDTRILRSWVKLNNKLEAAEVGQERASRERDEMMEELKKAEKQPTLIYVAGVKTLTDKLNQAHARNMLKAVGSEVNE